MFRAYVSVACTGSEIVLPTPAEGRIGYRIWNTLPPNTCRPWVGSILDVVRACAPTGR